MNGSPGTLIGATQTGRKEVNPATTDTAFEGYCFTANPPTTGIVQVVGTTNIPNGQPSDTLFVRGVVVQFTCDEVGRACDLG